MTGSATYTGEITATVEKGATYGSNTGSLSVVSTTTSTACAGCFLTLGLGVELEYKHFTDYTVSSSNVIVSTDLGNASPQLLAGISYQLPWHDPWVYGRIAGCNPNVYNADADGRLVYCYPWRAFVNAKFSTAAAQTLNGFTIGLSHRIAKSLDLMLGLSISPFNEVSPGFRNIAIQTTKTQQSLHNPNYTVFSIYPMQQNYRNAFDGFPTHLLQYTCTGTPQVCTTTDGGPIYQGSITGVQYLPGVFVGVVVPVQLKSLLGGK